MQVRNSRRINSQNMYQTDNNKKTLLMDQMITIKIIFSYDGSQFYGSATQPHKNTVQDKFEEVLKIIGINSILILSGRTDKNVHATGQVASLKIPYFWDFVVIYSCFIACCFAKRLQL